MSQQGRKKNKILLDSYK